MLWDTPGFGDSARLARRLAQQGNPIGWFLSQVWDRFRDRAFCSDAAGGAQRARPRRRRALPRQRVRGARRRRLPRRRSSTCSRGSASRSSCCSTRPAGRARATRSSADGERWRRGARHAAVVRAVTTLDAFARCWVQEIALFALVGDRAAAKRAARRSRRLVEAWQARRLAQFDEAMARSPRRSRARRATGAAARRGRRRRAAADRPRRSASASGAARRREGARRERRSRGVSTTRLRASTDRLIAIHGLDGRAKREVLARLAAGVAVDAPVDERKAAMMGGVVSGALTGLAADLAAGGFTFGAGMLDRRGARRARRRGHRARHEPGARQGGRRAALGRRVPGEPGERGAAALPRGRALRPRPRRLGRDRVPAVLAAARRRGRRRAARCVRRRVGDARARCDERAIAEALARGDRGRRARDRSRACIPAPRD